MTRSVIIAFALIGLLVVVGLIYEQGVLSDSYAWLAVSLLTATAISALVFYSAFRIR
jgi:uncharacterized membrane protein